MYGIIRWRHKFNGDAFKTHYHATLVSYFMLLTVYVSLIIRNYLVKHNYKLLPGILMENKTIKLIFLILKKNII